MTNQPVLPVFLVTVVFMIAGCEGPVGPEGPAGPIGSQGERGEQGDNVFMVWEQELQNTQFTEVDNVRTATFGFPELTEEVLAQSVLVSYYVSHPSTWVLPLYINIPERPYRVTSSFGPGSVSIFIYKDFDGPQRFSVTGATLRVVVFQ